MAYSLNNFQYKSSGSVSNCTFYKMMDKLIVRSMAHHVNNPRSPAQELNRLNIQPLINAYRQIKPVLYKSLNYRTSRRKAYHEFLSLNLGKSIINGNFYPSLFKVSSDCFPATPIDLEVLQSGIFQFRLTWNPILLQNQSNSDILCIVTFNTLTQFFNYKITDCNRAEAEFYTTLSLPADNESTYYYFFFVKSNYSQSGSAYIHYLAPLI